jgi:NADPH:quinone reductase
VRAGGLIVAFQSSGPVPPMDIARLSGLTGEGLPGSLWLTWPSLTDYNATGQALIARGAAALGRCWRRRFDRAIAEVLPIRDAARAHQLLQARKVIGKVLLQV